MNATNRFKPTDHSKYAITRNIVILPLLFTPLVNTAFAFKKSDQSDKAAQQIQNIATQKYTVNIGETAESIAQKFNMSVEMLQSLNSAQPFNLDISNLKPNDVVLVPLSALPKNIAVASAKVLSPNEIKQQTKIASLASQVGTTLSNDGNTSDAASALVRNMASNAVNSSLENWFSKYGRLRAQIETDEKFSLKNSQFDAMLPLWENEKNLVFTQTSFHNTDDRNQGNLGFGLRHFYDNFMIGGNAFIDYDFSNKHQRAGIGAEYWSNFLKVSANGYMRLSDWKESKQVEDYSERAANGWDLRTEGYLPIYPQLGAKLMYEQYYGDEVALFGRDNRRHNPNAVTAGISYTPVPLISLNVDHKQGQDGQKDTIFGLQMNYQIGVPFAKQLDPRAVAALRSLAGNKYDFVNRNNNIVLEYKKNETIWLHLDPELQGLAGETKPLNVSVESKYGVDHIEWNAESLTAAGGEIIQNGNSYSIKMPAYQMGRDAIANTYSVSAVAFDSKGNASARQSMTVKVSQAAVSEVNSSFTPNTLELVANGKDSKVLTLKVNDASNNPIDVSEKDIELKVTSNSAKAANTTVSDWKKVSTGVYELTVTSGTQTEKLTLSPTVLGTPLPTATVNVAEGDVAELNSSLVASPKEIVADNTDESTLTLTLLDENKNPIQGKTVAFNVAGVEKTSISEVTEKNGVYTATLKGTQAGTATITSTVDGKALSLKDEVKMKAGAISEEKSSITASKATITACIDESEITLKLVDANDNAIEKGDVQFKAEGVTDSHFTEVTYVDGVYKAKFSSKDSGTAIISASYNNTQINKLSTQVQVVESIALTASITQEKVKIGESTSITAFVYNPTDSNKTPIANVEVEISFTDFNRQNVPYTDTYPLLINGVPVKQGEKLTYTTNDKGMIPDLKLEDPDGWGINHKFHISLKKHPQSFKVIHAIFTTITSPDVPQARMWGHMADTIQTQNGDVISRPKVIGEGPSPSSYDSYHVENLEHWQLHNVISDKDGVQQTCGDMAHASSKDNLVSLFNAVGANNINTRYGWPIRTRYNTNSYNVLLEITQSVDLKDGGVFTDPITNNGFTTCKIN